MRDDVASPVDEERRAGRDGSGPGTGCAKRGTAASAASPPGADREMLAHLDLLLRERPGAQPDDG